jgi:transcriptional regulator with XRE-family HTH domain
MLLEEFLKPLGISQVAFARRLGVSFPRLNGVIRGRRGVTPDTALRLERVGELTVRCEPTPSVHSPSPAAPDSQRCRWASASSTERNRRTPRGAWRWVPNARESDEAAHAAASPSSADADRRGPGISATSR